VCEAVNTDRKIEKGEVHLRIVTLSMSGGLGIHAHVPGGLGSVHSHIHRNTWWDHVAVEMLIIGGAMQPFLA
jgi:hypothetical protein